MPKYRVLRSLEHNGRLHLPEKAADETAPEKATSAGHGGEIPVDGSGSIELAEKEAAPLLARGIVEAMTNGQIEPVSRRAKKADVVEEEAKGKKK